ncbi:hypothetical protein [Noviherbaspirillum malthae]|uniref:hypothetical protein n=1 Tax=Noviherbaspirillum malthae TaxID=1260987 RepID=UPI00188E7A6C|nr:hypothetical protein [Noviherbaspirillum malthae]
MNFLNLNIRSWGSAPRTYNANAAADTGPPTVSNLTPEQMPPAANLAGRRSMSRPKWISGLTISKGKDAPKFDLRGPRQLGKWELSQPLDVNFRSTSAVFISVLRKNNILEAIGEDLKSDIEKVLAVYSDDQSNTRQKEAVNRNFLKLYAPLLKKNSYTTFENQAFRTLMHRVANEINKPDSVNALSTSRPLVSLASTALAVPPVRRLNFEATNLAFQIISTANAQNFVADQTAVRVTTPSPVLVESTPVPVDALAEAATATADSGQNSRLRRQAKKAAGSAMRLVTNLNKIHELKFSNLSKLLANEVPRHKPSTQVPSNLAPADRSTDEQFRRADEANRQAVSDMRQGNARFRTWLEQHDIVVATNRGTGLNCLLISLLQHATGEYGEEFEPLFSVAAEVIREALNIPSGMLYSDDVTASRIINWINTEYGTNMALIEVQANELGQPVITTPPERIPDDGDKVVIWQQGIHFEALYAKASQPASS